MSIPDFWSVLGTWVSGLSTLFVGVVALYTARPKLRPSLNIYCDYIVGHGSLEGQELIVINVANIASYPITINNVIWKFPISKISARQVVSKTDYSTTLPDTIQPAMQSTYMVSWIELTKQIPALLKTFEIRKPKYLRRTQIILNTSLGTIKSTVQPALHGRMIKCLKSSPK